MSASRLDLAIESGLFDPASGRLLAFRPARDADLSAFARERTLVVHGHRAAFDRLAADGWEVATEPEGRFDAAVVFLPRERLRARAMIARAAKLTDGPVVIDGTKSDGIEGMLREVRGRAEVGDVISKAHGKIFAARGGSFDGWQAEPLEADGFRIAPGLFSADGPDPGSVALAEALPRLAGAVADLGAGWGYLSAHVLRSSDVTHLHAVEAEHEAVACLSANLDDGRAALHWADALHWRPPGPLDAVVMNPPFHAGRRPDPEIGRAFVMAAGRMLGARGSLWMVANRHLPYEDVLERTFRRVEEFSGDRKFKLIHAETPKEPMR